ncbi:hypothetical protein HDR59_05350 [bacterium]|nr:hypothetical protein [bacterium]
MKKNWKKFLTNTDVIPTNKPLFPLRWLFILALVASIIFYRFVYIYLYPSKLGKILYDYNISHTSKIYIEGFFLTAWVIFLTAFLFKVSGLLYDYIIIPIIKILYYLLMKTLYGLDKLIEKIIYLLKRNKKTVAPKSTYDKIKKKLNKK